MNSVQFQALGTHWAIVVDGPALSDTLVKEIKEKTHRFESEFSRFIATSQSTQFRSKPAGKYTISPEMAHLLQHCDHLRSLTHGAFDPAVGGLLEHAGYDPHYSLKAQDADVEAFEIPRWHIHDSTLIISGPVVFDFGGIGKGYWIDQVANILTKAGVLNFLVDGGGDMVATIKQDSQPWRIAVAWPGKPDTAAGVVELRHQGFAASDTIRRSWGSWHHLVNHQSKQPQKHLIGAAAVAATAFLADQTTAVLCATPLAQHASIAQALEAEYLVFLPDGETTQSTRWPGKIR